MTPKQEVTAVLADGVSRITGNFRFADNTLGVGWELDGHRS
jgi:hypothetical protein